MSSGWEITVRDGSGARLGIVDVYEKLSLFTRHLDVGAWVLEMDLDDPLVPDLIAPGAGIIVKFNGAVKLSGPVRTPVEIKIDGASRSIAFTGPDDLTILRDRTAHPQPGTATPPYSGSAYDVRTGAGETVIKAYVDVNAGPGATLARREPGFSIATDLTRGATVTGRFRWGNLLDRVAELATLSGLGLRCLDRVFDVYQPVDRSADVEFSTPRGSLAGLSYRRDAPAATYAYVGGGGEGTARTIVEAENSSALADGWPRIEVFADRRDTTDPTELAQAATSALIGEDSAGTDRVGVSITTTDTDGTEYGVDYEVGDVVSWVDPWGTKFPLSVQAAKIEITPSGVNVEPTLGTIVPEIPAQFQRLRSLARRTSRLEQR